MGEAFERVPTPPDDRQRAGLISDAGKLVDIRAGDETVGLARADDERLGRIAFKQVQRFVQFAQHLARKRVRGRADLVQREPGDTVGFAFNRPVLHQGSCVLK